MTTYYVLPSLPAASVGHTATSIIFAVVVALPTAVTPNVVASAKVLATAKIVVVGVTIVVGETIVVGTSKIVVSETIVIGVTIVVATIVVGGSSVEVARVAPAPKIFGVSPHSEGAAIRVAPGAVAVGAVALAVAVAGTRL